MATLQFYTPLRGVSLGGLPVTDARQRQIGTWAVEPDGTATVTLTDARTIETMDAYVQLMRDVTDSLRAYDPHQTRH